MTDRILLSPPDVGLEEELAVLRAIRSGWVAPLGPEVDAFESEVADFVGVGFAVAVSSGTAALHLALRAVGVIEGDIVITGTMTFVATANAILYVGAKPVFVDSLADGTMSPEFLKEAIAALGESSARIAAIIPIDIYGRMANSAEIVDIASQNGIPVIVDSAESIGASQGGRRAGSFGDCSIFSFNGNKIMTTSGGGMLLTNDAGIATYARHLATQAKENTPHYEHLEMGYNYRMSNLLAAIGRAQLKRLPGFLLARRKTRRKYMVMSSTIEGLSILPGNPEEDNCWLTALMMDSVLTGWRPLDLQEHLESLSIESRPLWKPMHLQPLFRNAPYFGRQVAEGLFSSGLALPSGSGLSDSSIQRVVESIGEAFGDQ